MGCKSSKAVAQQNGGGRSVRVKKPPKFKAKPLMTKEELEEKREDFWFTRVEGNQVVWETLKAAVNAEDEETMNVLIEAAGIITPQPTLATCYDETGKMYQIPDYVLSDPVAYAKS